MPINDDGNIIRAYGYVFIYSGNLESAIEECYEQLIRIDAMTDYPTQLSFTKKGFFRKKEKIEDVLKRVLGTSTAYQAVHREEYENILNRLTYIGELMNDRNELAHRPLLGGQTRSDYIVLRDGTKQDIDSRYVYDLANMIFEGCSISLELKFIINHYFAAEAT